MKNKILNFSILALGLLSNAKGATAITAANYTLTTPQFAEQILTDSVTKTPFVGNLLIGTFTSTTGLGTQPVVSLASFGWTLFGSTPFNTSTNQKGLFGATGVTGTLPETATGAFIGNNIFAVVANAAGTDFIIWNSGIKFQSELAGVGGTGASFLTKDVTLVRGQVVTAGNNLLAGAIASQNGKNALTFGAAVPEPSSALLAAFGGIALLRRRRN